MNKIKTLLVLAIGLATLMADAQNVTTPYSMYGYGILSDRATSMQRQMGGVGYAMSSGRQVNVMNPASYAAIDSLTFLFDMGADIAMLWNKEGESREHSIGGGLDYITMQFPLSSHIGASIGLLPYSSVGYAFGNDIHNGTRNNQGSGGINLAYGGVAGKIGPVSVGVNVAYSFGSIRNDIYTTPESQGNTLFEHVMQIRDWDINIGVQYRQTFGQWHRGAVGLTYTPKKSLHGKSWITEQETKADSRPDTLGRLNLKGNYYTPTSIGAGLSYTYERHSRLTVEADMTLQNWKDAKYSPLYSDDDPKKVLFEGMEFANRVRCALGGEYMPKIRGNYLQRMSYRAGVSYCADYLKINGNQVKEIGVNCGFGFPTADSKTLVNVGFGWMHRRAYPEALVTENYFNITLGVNFNELWFWQRKIR